jgi:hypothetical protein
MIFRNAAGNFLELEHILWRTQILKKIENCTNPSELANINLVPLKTSPNNTNNVSTILLLTNSHQHQGLGKMLVHENLTIKNDGKNSEKMKLLSTILLTTTPLKIKILDYHSEIVLEYSLLIGENAKSTDFFHAISTIIRNQVKFFEDPGLVIIGNDVSGEKSKVRP